MRTPRIVAILAVALIAVVVGGIASADPAVQSVSCSYDPAVSTGCSAPQAPVTVTETSTATVTPAPVTSTVTETPAPVTTTQTVTVTQPGPTITVTTTAPTTTAATTTAAAGCAGAANTEGGADPFGTCWPGPATTGVPAGTTLTAYTGSLNVSTANTVIDAKTISGCLNVTAAGVTVKRSKITCGGGNTYGIYNSGAGLTVQDTEVICTGGGGTTGIGDRNLTVARVNIHGCENGFDADMSATISDSDIHDLFQSAAAHTDGFQSFYTTSNITLTHNVFYGSTGTVDGTSAINVSDKPSGNTATNVTIQKNLIAGGAFTLYCTLGPSVNEKILSNVFSRKFHSVVGFYGPSTDCGNEAQVSGNTYDNGSPISPG